MKKFKKSVGAIAIITAGLLLATGCSKVSNDVVASVDGVKITKEQVKDELKRLRRPPTESDVRRTLDRLIENSIYLAEAKRMGLDQTEEYRRAVENFSRNYLIRELTRKFMSQNEFAKKITEGDLRKYYEEHRDEFRARKTFVVNHFSSIDEGIARKFYSKVKKSPPGDFVKLARKFAGKNMGKVIIREREFVEVPSSRYGVDFSKELEKLTNGKMSGIIKGKAGRYHVVMVINRRDIPERKFEQVKNNIRARILSRERVNFQKKFREELRNKYQPQRNPEAIKSLISEVVKSRAKKPVRPGHPMNINPPRVNQPQNRRNVPTPPMRGGQKR